MPYPKLPQMYDTSRFTQSPALATKVQNARMLGSFASAGATAVNPMLGAAVAGGTQLLAQLMQNLYTRSANKQARAWSLADRAHEEWYNSPVMQKLRALEAGLAPADYVSDVATQTNTPTPQAPDMSFLSNAGTSMVEGAMNMQTFNQNKDLAHAQVKLLEAQAEEAYQRALTSRERYQLELAKSRLDNSYLGKQISYMEKQIEESDLDIASKEFANKWATDTRDLNYQLLEGNVEGVKLSNDFKSLEIKGKNYEISHILPEQYDALLRKKDLDEAELEKLQYTIAMMMPEYREAFATDLVIQSNYEEYYKSIQDQVMSDLHCDQTEAEMAMKFAVVNSVMNNFPLLKQLLGLASKAAFKGKAK